MRRPLPPQRAACGARPPAAVDLQGPEETAAHYLIEGAGPAGFSAADTIRRLRPDVTITIVADGPHGHYSRPGLACVLTRELPETRLFPISKKSEARCSSTTPA